MLRVYTPFQLSRFSAQQFYRQSQPVSFLQQEGLAHCYFDLGELGHNDREAAQDYASIHILHQNVSPEVQDAIERYMQRSAHWLPAEPGQEPEWDCPPSIVLDTDDDVFNAMPFHKGTFRFWGTKDLDGRPLEPGEALAEKKDDDSIEVLFEDGVDGFSIEANRRRIGQWRTNLAIAALVTVSTPQMERVVKREVPNANTFVLPNCINFDDYPQLLPFVDDGIVRVLWQGGSGHEECLREVLPALIEAHDKHENVEFLFWGGVPADIATALDSPRWKVLPWCSYFEYKLRLNSLGHDINICPLFEHSFNAARSAIKWYESSACSKPAATLAKNFAAFGDEIVDGENGMLYSTLDEFREKLDKLILDKSLRVRLAEAAKQWVRENRDPREWAKKYAAKLEELRAYKKALWKAPLAPVESSDVPAEHTDVRGS